MRVLVTGAAGQLGRAIVERFSADAEVIAHTRHELDVSNEGDVLHAVRAAKPDAIVNCSAYNAVDQAEDDAPSALAVNGFAVLNLARGAREVGATLVHYGTDFVFDGRSTEPYTEADRPVPESTYGMSKLLGEWFAAEAPRHYVLRVESLFGGTRAKSSIDKILDAIIAGEPARVFIDRTVTPSYVADVAEATLRVLQIAPEPGVYHCVNTGATTWLGIAQEAARLLEREAQLVPVPVASVPMRARRPKYCALSNEKLRQGGINMPTWQDALARYVRDRSRGPSQSESRNP